MLTKWIWICYGLKKTLLCSYPDSESSTRKTLRNVAIPVNIAVVGISGVGKSSFINAIRDLTADDEGAAAVGVVETTTEIASYTHPENCNIKFWDLPGVGTDKFPQADYLRLISVDQYDFFVVMSASRFFETDAWLVNEISRRGKKFVFVRTKVDVDVRNDKKAHPRTNSQEAVLSEILTSTKEHLKSIGQSSAELFLIDSYKREKYDFERLGKKLLCEMPELKSSVMTKSRCIIS